MEAQTNITLPPEAPTQMLVPTTVGVMEELLEQFKPCFSKPQFRNFSTSP